MSGPVVLDGNHLTLSDVVSVARQGRPVEISAEARARMEKARAAVLHIVSDGRPVYGVNTGFGRLSDRIVPKEQLPELQRNLVRSHASGVGPDLPRELVRAMMLLRANSLAKGVSGVRVEVVETLLAALHHDLVPAIPEQGSVGASGDLAPLAHLALALMGEGEVIDERGHRMPSSGALAKAKVPPITLVEKEGISLVNGTCLMASQLSFLVHDGEALLRISELAAAVSFDALKGNVGALDPRLHEARNLPAQSSVAAEMRTLLSGSSLTRAPGDYQGQDPYVLRCIPQVLGAVRLGLSWARSVAEGELNAASDNPLVFDGEFLSGGNFHGQPLALALDTVGLALSYLGSFSERRTARLVDADLSRGLSPFLSASPGFSSGYMIPPYVAASLVAEDQVLVHPASAASLPTSANQEDFNSMGATAGRKGLRLLENLRRILAIELMVGVQALEQRGPSRGGKGSETVRAAVRTRIPPLTEDRPPAPDIERLYEALREGSFLADVERSLGA
ncbi:MAG: histidine ammonia-lyase [Euryarchaeota archaeon]|nr:histidine ammonia-lyase [Euryarchaeota archaeon]MDE2043808.1 histidine ammonia-lyase [Thermoplasmata archaeon]